jgi:hypothetical protein
MVRAAMKIIVEIEFEKYYRFLGRCDPTSSEYKLLKSGIETSDPRDPTVRLVMVLCASDEAKKLLELAEIICPDAVRDIKTSIDLARTP